MADLSSVRIVPSFVGKRCRATDVQLTYRRCGVVHGQCTPGLWSLSDTSEVTEELRDAH